MHGNGVQETSTSWQEKFQYVQLYVPFITQYNCLAIRCSQTFMGFTVWDSSVQGQGFYLGPLIFLSCLFMLLAMYIQSTRKEKFLWQTSMSIHVQCTLYRHTAVHQNWLVYTSCSISDFFWNSKPKSFCLQSKPLALIFQHLTFTR